MVTGRNGSASGGPKPPPITESEHAGRVSESEQGSDRGDGESAGGADGNVARADLLGPVTQSRALGLVFGLFGPFVEEGRGIVHGHPARRRRIELGLALPADEAEFDKLAQIVVSDDIGWDRPAGMADDVDGRCAEGGAV